MAVIQAVVPRAEGLPAEAVLAAVLAAAAFAGAVPAAAILTPRKCSSR